MGLSLAGFSSPFYWGLLPRLLARMQGNTGIFSNQGKSSSGLALFLLPVRWGVFLLL